MKTSIGVLISCIVFQIVLVVLIGHFAPLLVTTDPLRGTLPTPSIYNVLSYNGSGILGMFGFDSTTTMAGNILADIFWGIGLIEVIAVIYLIRGD